MSNRKPAPLTLTSLALAMILCSGCLGSNEPQESSRDISSEERVEVGKDKQQAKEEKEKIAREPIPRNEKFLALEEHENGLDVALLRLRRASDNTLNIQLRYINNTDEEVALCARTDQSSNNGLLKCYRNDGSSWLANIYIVDNINQKKHLIVRAGGKPMTTKVNVKIAVLSPGSSYKVWAKVPAPPADVESVSLYIPGTIPMEDISIED